MLSVLIILPLYYGVRSVIDTVHLQSRGERMSGTVTRAYSESRGRRNRNPSYRYDVRYDSNGDGIMENKKFAAPLFTLSKEYSAGDTVTVIQDLRNPENAELDRGIWTWILAYTSCVLVVAFGAIMFMLLGFLLKTGKLFPTNKSK